MKFVLVGLSHRTAPVEVRERAFIPESAVGECVQRLVDRDLIESGVLLSTCNRIELYAMSAAEDAQERLLQSFGWRPHKLPFEAWRRYAYGLADDEALSHLFRVAGGLDSMVLGEAQILGQLKGAIAQARQAGGVDARLQIILQGALRAGKRVRHETELGRRPVSISHAAVARSREVLGDLGNRGVLLVGAGTMSQVALRLLKNQRIGPIYLTSRTLERADRVAEMLGGQPVAFEAVDDIIHDVDIIISSTGAPHYLFDPARIQGLQARRADRPLLIIDIALPRDVDPRAGQIAGVHLYNIDDLQSAATTNLEARKASLPLAERIIDEELAHTRRALEARESAPAVRALVQHVERLRDHELARQLDRVPPSDAEMRKAMRDLAEALTAKFLDGPVRALRDSPDPVLEAAVLAEAFDLRPETAPDG